MKPIVNNNEESWMNGYKAGIRDAEKDMMNDALDGIIIGFPKDADGAFVQIAWGEWKDVVHLPVVGKIGDKVKLIIIN